MTDSESQDSLSMDGTFFLVNADPKIKTSASYEHLMQEVLNESQERISTPTDETIISKIESEIPKCGNYLFENVFYLGYTVIQKSNDPIEVNKCISEFSKLNRPSQSISLLVPFSNKNSLKMIDVESQLVISEFPITRVGFCTSGFKGQFGEYLAFTFLQYDNLTNNNTSSNEIVNVLQCHIFKFKSTFFTDRILECFRKAFDSSLNSISTSQLNVLRTLSKTFNVQFKLTIDIKEDDGNGKFVTVSKEDNQIFKLRSNVKKKIIIKLEQIDSSLVLHIERCMGLFIGAGRYLNDTDMSLLEMDSLGEFNKSDAFVISGEWNPGDKGFELLNNTREKDQQVYMTIGINFYVHEIEAPLCLKIVCKAKIYSESQRFWLTLRKSTILHLMLCLEEMTDNDAHQILIGKYVTKTIQYIWPDNIFTVNCHSSQEGNNVENVESDSDELVKSGGGTVSKEITDEQLITRWGILLSEWQNDITSRPKGLYELVRHGIPEALRGEVWQLMGSSLTKELQLQDVYRILITKETKYDAVIKRDMPRTFTAHPLFLQKDGHGQQALFHVCKAYASYDEEIGYCQGSAFLAAALILHMPEEQAFSLLVSIMNKYQIRDVFKNNFEGLHICLYQLDHLMAEKLTDLHQHFTELQLESHMYANQWFMTLFTMKFHLYAVFHILDLFLYEGLVVIFKVALALLKLSRKELLTMDFEGALNYFRITLPKLYRNVDACKELINSAQNIKISNSKLSRLEKEWRKIQEVRAETEDPVDILNKELKKTKEEYNRLDQENDALAKELVSSKIALQRNIDKLERNNIDLEETVEVLSKELFVTKNSLIDALDDKQHLQDELKQVKDKFREEVIIREEKAKKQEDIIAEYKKIATKLSERSEDSKSLNILNKDDEVINHLKSIILECENCNERLLHNPYKDKPDSDVSTDVEPSPVYNDELQSKVSQIICMTKNEYDQQQNQIYETELILANTKLLLVESHCKEQKLTHELNYLKTIITEQKEVIDSSNNSIIKKLWNLREKPSSALTYEQRTDQNTKSETRHSFCQSENMQDREGISNFHKSISQDWFVERISLDKYIDFSHFRS